MTMYTKENVIAVSLGTAFGDGISASISVPEVPVFNSGHYCDISWFF